jgi:hypothetical protein
MPDCDPAAWETKDVGPSMTMADVTATSFLDIFILRRPHPACPND